MRISDLKVSGVSLASSAVSSLCCLLPVAVVALGLGSGAFMAVTMQYSNIFITTGIVGVSLGYYLYFRERRRCAKLVCQMAGTWLCQLSRYTSIAGCEAVAMSRSSNSPNT